jgi:signal transduction histidine kinase
VGMVVPLVARGSVIGAITLAADARARRYTPFDLVFAEELGRRAALAVDNARLYRDAQRAAAAREEILAVVSHDLRNPLNAIRLATQLLMEASSDRRITNQKSLEVIDRAGRQMGRLIEDLLEVSTDGSSRVALEPEAQATDDLLREACALMERLAGDKEVRLLCEANDPLPRVHADRDRVLQVLSNLIGNAIKFTPAGGAIRVDAHPCGDAVRICVRDSGVGIAREALPHVFDRFWQGDQHDHRGAGLGLSIVKHIVEAHGGTIWAESDAGAGSTFCFTLPVHAGE